MAEPRRFTRRAALLAALAAAGGSAAAHVRTGRTEPHAHPDVPPDLTAFPDNAFESANPAFSDITRDWLHDPAHTMRLRTSYGPGGFGVHPYTSFQTMHEDTHRQAGRVVADLIALGRDHSPDGERWDYEWTGVVGAKVMKVGYHRFGAAIDFSRFSWGPDRFVDLAVHGDGDRTERRRYLAALAVCRKHFGTVLHLHNDPDGSHWNHIHVDLGRHPGPVDVTNHSDGTIVRWAARDLIEVEEVGEREVEIGGRDGGATAEAMARLIDRFGLDGVEPTASRHDAEELFDAIARHAFQDRAAGT